MPQDRRTLKKFKTLAKEIFGTLPDPRAYNQSVESRVEPPVVTSQPLVQLPSLDAPGLEVSNDILVQPSPPDLNVLDGQIENSHEYYQLPSLNNQFK